MSIPLGKDTHAMLHSYQHAWVEVENATKDGAQPMHTHSSDRGVKHASCCADEEVEYY